MSIPAGTRLGPYDIEALIGAGGMGEVYQAHDRKLGRNVAIKVLPEQFARDPERLARLQREAKMLAALNHPNIATVYGFEESDGTHYVVMELVPGDTLEQRIKRDGPLPVTGALQIATQIAEALEAAHNSDKGIIHRDLKPANVKLTPHGRVKVLDFGLAKAFAADSSTDNTSNSPTLSALPTIEGAIMGTAAYMSPEQARGKPIDKRSDIWALGCVMYELLSGKRAFAGDNTAEIISRVLQREPDWQELPDSTPARIHSLLKRCLQKDQNLRLRDAGDARIEMQEILTAPPDPEPVAAIQAGTSRSRINASVWIATCLLLAVLTGIVVWRFKPEPGNAPRREARFLLPVSPDLEKNNVRQLLDSPMVLSPDGDYFVFTGQQDGKSQLYLGSIGETGTKTVQGSDGALWPFFSPDSRWLAFFSHGKLRKVSISGGLPSVLCDAPSGRGGSWSEQGFIVFGPSARGTGIYEVSANGGAPKPITTLDVDKGETSHRLPEVLPGGDIVLYTAYGATYQDVSIVALSLKTNERKVLIEGASFPHYVSTGHIVYVQPKLPGVVMAVAFDPAGLRLSGTPVPILENVLTNRGDSAQWAISRSGMLLYEPGGLQEAANDLVWVDRKGNASPTGAPRSRSYTHPRISPDGHRIVVSMGGAQTALWIYDLIGKTFTRLTFEGNNGWPVWTPDGKHITYASNRSQPWTLFSKAADGSGKEESLAGTRGNPYSWTPDGKLLAYNGETSSTHQDILLLSLAEERKSQPFLKTPAEEMDAYFSPDGHWIAYVSNESGHDEVYVQTYPPSGGKWQISTEGGREPAWTGNGRELLYRNGDAMMAATITTEPVFQAAPPRTLFRGNFELASDVSRNYDIADDDQRLLMLQPSELQATPPQFNVVLNWFEELKRRVPTGMN
jgi:serine/threonine protein kinase/Tol biopolymer transport system component